MKSAALSTVCEINPRDNGSFRLKDTSEVSFLPMAAVGEMGTGIIEEQTRLLSEVRRGYTPFQRGDVLIAKITPCFQNGKLAIAAISREVGFGTTEFHVLRPHDGQLDNRYLFHFLRRPSIHEGGVRRMTGTGGQLRVPSGFFTELSIPLPALAEQKRIAAVLDSADDMRGKRRRALATLDTLLQSVFFEMFGDVAKLDRAPLREVCDSVDSGSTPRAVLLLDSLEPDAVPFIKVNHIIEGGRVSHAVRPFFIPREVHSGPLRRSQCMPGDILINIVGPPLGKIGMVPPGIGECNINQAIVRVRPGKRLVPLFLLHALLAPKLLTEVIALGHGIRQLNISVNEIRDFAVPVPSIAAQQKFADIVSRTQRLREGLMHARNESDTLFAALQSAAFAGTLFKDGGVKEAAGVGGSALV